MNADIIRLDAVTTEPVTIALPSSAPIVLQLTGPRGLRGPRASTVPPDRKAPLA